jgi:adenylylsulfate kinase
MLAARGRRPNGFIVWLTGLSGAGKTTLARALQDRLIPDRSVETLDGDEMRRTLCSGLGYSKADREINIRRIGYVARLLARNGVAVIVAAIAPYRDGRDEVRRLAGHEGVLFLEVFLDASIDVLIARDVKGLYSRALAGTLPEFTGISAPYERPESPDLVVRTDHEAVADCTERILGLLRERRLLPGEPR